MEILILDQLFDKADGVKNYAERKQSKFSKRWILETFGLSDEQGDLIVENLYRLNLCQAPAGVGIAVGEHKFALRTTEIFEFTTLGYYFVDSFRWD